MQQATRSKTHKHTHACHTHTHVHVHTHTCVHVQHTRDMHTHHQSAGLLEEVNFET